MLKHQMCRWVGVQVITPMPSQWSGLLKAIGLFGSWVYLLEFYSLLVVDLSLAWSHTPQAEPYWIVLGPELSCIDPLSLAVKFG